MAWRTALGAATEARHSSVAGERSSIHNNTAGACLAVGLGDRLVQYQPVVVTCSQRQGTRSMLKEWWSGPSATSGSSAIFYSKRQKLESDAYRRCCSRIVQKRPFCWNVNIRKMLLDRGNTLKGQHVRSGA